MVSTREFKDALASWATGVTVVTTESEGLLYGLTVSSFSSLSLEPPLVLVCLSHRNRLVDMIRTSGRFAVSILGREQEEASDYFATPGREPTPGFVKIPGAWTPDRLPIVEDAIGWVACEVHELSEQGDHTIVVGRVTAAAADPEGRPLLYHRRAYHGLGE